jgi:hypothetical protein
MMQYPAVLYKGIQHIALQSIIRLYKTLLCYTVHNNVKNNALCCNMIYDVTKFITGMYNTLKHSE